MDNLETTFGTFLTTRLEMRLAGSPSDYEQNSVKVKNLATYLHEHIHFFQAIFTGYGHIQWDSHRQMTSFTFSNWKKLNDLNEGVIKLPLSNCDTSPESKAFSQFIYEAASEQIKISKAKFYMINGSLSLKQCGLLSLNHDWRANPVRDIGGKHIALQTKDILEGHAYFIERSFLEKECEINSEIAWSREGVKEQYTAAYDWFIQKCGKSKHEYFPVICDLALQISWYPVIPTTEEEWQASNPSWRFVKLTDTLASNPTFSLEEPENWHETYAKFCSELLSICGYMQLEEVFKERLAAFSRKKSLMQIEEVMKKGILFRMSKPWISVNPVHNVNELSTLLKEFKTPYIIFEEGFFSFGTPSVSGAEIIFELQYQAFTDQVLGNFSESARVNSKIECAFSKYNIGNVCIYQKSHGCKGQLSPKDDIPFPRTINPEGNLEGCSFDWLLKTMDINMKDIEINFNSKFTNLRKKQLY